MGTGEEVDEYIRQLSTEKQEIMEEIRKGIQKQFPEAIEVFSYQMPAFRMHSIFVYYGAFKKHIGIYPPLTADENLIKETACFRNKRGNLAIPISDTFPMELVLRVTKALGEQATNSI